MANIAKLAPIITLYCMSSRLSVVVPDRRGIPVWYITIFSFTNNHLFFLILIWYLSTSINFQGRKRRSYLIASSSKLYQPVFLSFFAVFPLRAFAHKPNVTTRDICRRNLRVDMTPSNKCKYCSPHILLFCLTEQIRNVYCKPFL